MGRKSKANVRRKEILQNFFEVMKEEGIEGTSIAKVALRMEVNPSLLIHYFSSKEEITLAFADYALEKFKSLIPHQLEQISDARERWNALLDWVCMLHKVNRKEWSIYYGLLASVTRDAHNRSRMQELHLAYLDFIEREVQQAAQQQLIDAAQARTAPALLGSIMAGMRETYYLMGPQLSRNKQEEVRAFLSTLFPT
ncbi:MAG: TetR/AcrR family transcriptional regulator [Bacteroidetes bacterium]|nr:MAG: TetR/AcrR family transcriptional regulator [Bacteroidota bacterium]